MAAPTNAAYVKKALANSEPSTHGTYPRMIVSDNGTEFTSNTILTWQQEHDVEWHYIAPGNRCRMASWKASTAADRIDPARVCEPFHRLGRGPSWPHPANLCSLIQRNQNAPIIGQRCAGLSTR
jgi:transposase InsO family protein